MRTNENLLKKVWSNPFDLGLSVHPQNSRLNVNAQHLNETAEKLICRLAQKDVETAAHVSRVAMISVRLGREMSLKEDELKSLRLGSLLHDVGKIMIPNGILKKPGQLADNEKHIMQQHAVYGKIILQQLKFPHEVWVVAAEHHERFDGAGYPLRMSGNNIHLYARMFAIVDAYDAITSNRCYRRGSNYLMARDEIERGAGAQFDPAITKVFLKVKSDEWQS